MAELAIKCSCPAYAHRPQVEHIAGRKGAYRIAIAPTAVRIERSEIARPQQKK